jgi:hypothetical protein
MTKYLTFVLSHYDVIMGFLFWPSITALLTLAFKKHTAAEWEAWAMKNPFGAFIVEFCKANGFDIGKNALLLERFAARRSGKVPADIWDKLPVSPVLRDALKNPDVQAQFTRLLAPRPPSDTPPST